MEALREACGLGCVLTVEDHHADTGMGSILSVAMARHGLLAKMRNLGVTRYGDSGPSPAVLAAMGLDEKGIAQSFLELREGR